MMNKEFFMKKKLLFAVTFVALTTVISACDSDGVSNADNTPSDEKIDVEQGSFVSSSSEVSDDSNQESSSSYNILDILFSSSSESFSFGELIDERDGQVYKTIVIADSTRSQTWMAENLNFEYKTDPSSSEPNNYCHSDSADICKKFGRLYTWSAAIDSAGIYNNDAKGCGDVATCEMAGIVHGICPKGYHLPSTDEFETLQKITYAHGPTAGKVLKSRTDDWQDVQDASGYMNHTYGSDSYGFGALPTHAPGSKYAAIFWTCSKFSGKLTSHGGALEYAFEIIGYKWPDMSPIETELEYKSKHFSVRCVQDAN